MIQNLEIQNFRSHRSVELTKLSRVNLLLGKNNSGKTVTLEALFFLSLPYNPRDVFVRLNELRGYGPGTDFEEIWDSLFYNWDRSQEITVAAEEPSPSGLFQTDQLEGTLFLGTRLRIRPLVGGRTGKLSSGVIESSELMDTTQGLQFLFQLADGRSVEQEVTDLTSPPGRRGTVGGEGERPVVFIPGRGIPDPQEEAHRFSRLEVANRHEAVVEALRLVEPRLQRLTVVATRGGSVLYGDLGGNHLMPVPLMGDGMLRTLSIVLAMVNSQGGLVLIDEVENGLHYSVLTDLWRMIVQTARRLEVQVFAATHSDECIRALHEAVEALGYQEDLRLYRFDLTANGTRAVDYSADELSAAIASEQEVR